MKINRVLVCPLVAVALWIISGSKAEASFLVNITQSGSDVVATGFGTINTAGLIFYMSASDGTSSVIPDIGALALSAPGFDGAIYGGIIAGPANFGSVGESDASSGAGDTFGFAPLVFSPYGFVIVPVGYTSGAILSDNSTWDSTTIADLGLIPGRYLYTWGSGATADSFTLNIAPEPGSLSLLVIGSLGVLHHLRRVALHQKELNHA